MRSNHISPDEAFQAHRTLGAKTSLAVHFGTFRLGDDGQDDPLRDLQNAISADPGAAPFLVLHPGDQRSMP